MRVNTLSKPLRCKRVLSPPESPLYISSILFNLFSFPYDFLPIFSPLPFCLLPTLSFLLSFLSFFFSPPSSLFLLPSSFLPSSFFPFSSSFFSLPSFLFSLSSPPYLCSLIFSCFLLPPSPSLYSSLIYALFLRSTLILLHFPLLFVLSPS